MIRIPPGPLPRDAAVGFADVLSFGARLAGRLNGRADIAPLDIAAHAGPEGEAMLVIEGTDGAGASATWVVSPAPGGRIMLEEFDGEIGLGLLAEGPTDRIVARLEVLVGRVAVDA